MGVFSKLKRLFGRGGDAPAAAGAAPALQPSFIPLNALEEALMRAADDASARQAFVNLLLTSDLLVATPDAPDHPEQRTLDADETVSIVNMMADNGVSIPAVFTSEQRLAECFGPGTGYLALNGRTLVEIIVDAGAWVNPSSSYGVHWSADDLAAILGRPVPRTLTEDTNVMLGEPQDRPAALIADLTARLAADGRIDEAWLALAHWPADDHWGWYLDLRADVSPDDVLPDLQAAFTTDNLAGRPIDILVQARGLPPGTGIRLKPATSH